MAKSVRLANVTTLAPVVEEMIVKVILWIILSVTHAYAKQGNVTIDVRKLKMDPPDNVNVIEDINLLERRNVLVSRFSKV